MSAALTLSHEAKTEYTMIANAFIDCYMPQANGSYVKVYLYFLRLSGEPSCSATLSAAAELLDETEKDIERALKYWEKQKLVQLARNAADEITGIMFLPVFSSAAADRLRDSGTPDRKSADTEADIYRTDLPAGAVSRGAAAPKDQTGQARQSVPAGSMTCTQAARTPGDAASPAHGRFEKPDYSEAQITALASLDEGKWLISRLEQTLGRLLKPADLQTLLFLYESIGFPVELIVYLYEYCASKNKKSSSYIEAVAIAWAQAGVDTIEKAETETAAYSQNYNVVNRAFGLNRAPGNIEMKYIRRWFDTFGFDAGIIEEACNRTMLSVSKPDFKYADSILARWHEAGIKKKEDIAALDSEFARKNAYQNARQKEERQNVAPAAQNRFGAFPQRKYTASDYSAMEGMLLRKDAAHAD